MSAGLAGTSDSCSMNVSRSSLSIGFQRFSNPSVRHGLSTQAGAADGAGEVPGIDLEVVRQRQELLVEAGIEPRGILAGSTRKIGTPDGADEQCIPRQHEPRVGTAFEIGDHQADALRRVTRRVKHFHAGVAKFDLVAVMKAVNAYVTSADSWMQY